MAYSRSILGESEEDFSRSVLGGSEEYFSRTLLGGSDEVHEIHCEPCKKEGNTAVKHCLDCSEYFCAQCFKSHTRLKAFQNHVTNEVGKANPVIIKYSAETISKSLEAVPQQHMDCKSEQKSSRPTNETSSNKPNRKVKAELVSSIEVRTRRDNQKPQLRDLTIVHTLYCVFTDNKNRSVKVVDTRRSCVISEVHISEAEGLICITSVNDGEIAVSAVDVQRVWRVLFLTVSTSGIITNTGRFLDIRFGYNDILYHNDHFYATYADNVYKLNMSGQIMQKLNNKSFGLLYGIDVSNDHNTIYICSYSKDTVFSVDLEGIIEATYKDEELKGPNGVTVDSERYVYVCSTGALCVHQLTADLNKVQVIMSGICGRCIFNRAENRLFVTFRDQIKVYDLKYE